MKLRTFLPCLLATSVPLFADLPFKEDFDNNNNKWELKETQEWSAKIADGRLIYENLSTKKGYVNWSLIAPGYEKWHRDYEISVRVKILEGTGDEDAGIIWDAGEKTLMRFEIGANGRYSIYQRNENEFLALRRSAPTTAFKKDEDNELTIRIVDSTRAYFFVNDQLVDARDVHPIANAYAGIIVASGATGSFDHFYMSYLDSAKKALAPAWEKELAPRLRELGPKAEDFTEAFDDNKNEWPNIKSGEGWSATIADGVLRWQNLTKEGLHSAAIQHAINGEYDYELTAKIRSVTGANNAVGISWDVTGKSSEGANFDFGQGQYRFYYNSLPPYQNIAWTSSSAVKKEGGNELKVRKLKNSVFLFINGQLIADRPFLSSPGAELGITIGSGTTAEFDEIRLTYLKQSEAEIQAEYDKNIAYLKANHRKGELGVLYTDSLRMELIHRDNEQERARLGLDRTPLDKAGDKERAKVQKAWSAKKLLSLYGSWGRPVFISPDGSRIYYNYRLLGRTQYYYLFYISKMGKDQKDWYIDNADITADRS